MDLPISYHMAAMSHLSDAQELANMGADPQAINHHINFTKRIIMKQMTHDAMATQEELDQIWNETR